MIYTNASASTLKPRGAVYHSARIGLSPAMFMPLIASWMKKNKLGLRLCPIGAMGIRMFVYKTFTEKRRSHVRPVL